MEAVKAFNNELSSLYESKLPVSQRKMARITESAMKAVKFYKHVVQSVERFISKCPAAYKVPGLYVIDSVVRQSRYQFGVEKDVFGQRFSKNLINTFQTLVSCPEDDKNKIVQVLDIWEKKNAFPRNMLKQLFSLFQPNEDSGTAVATVAAESSGEYPNSQGSDASDGEEMAHSSLQAAQEPKNGSLTEKTKGSSFSEIGNRASTATSQFTPGDGTKGGTNVETDVLPAAVQLLQSSHQQPVTQFPQHQLLQQFPQPLGSLSLLQQLLQQLSHQPSSSLAVPAVQPQPQTDMLRGAAPKFDQRLEETSQGSEPSSFRQKRDRSRFKEPVDERRSLDRCRSRSRDRRRSRSSHRSRRSSSGSQERKRRGRDRIPSPPPILGIMPPMGGSILPPPLGTGVPVGFRTLMDMFSEIAKLSSEVTELREKVKAGDVALHVLESKVNSLQTRIDIDRLLFLLTDMNVYIHIAKKIRLNQLEKLTAEERKTLLYHGKRRVIRPGMAGIFDLQNCKGHSTITNTEVEEAAFLLNSHPGFVESIQDLTIETVVKHICKARTAVAVVQQYIDRHTETADVCNVK